MNVAVDACTAGRTTADTVEVDAGTYTLAIPGGDEDAAETGDLDLTGGGPVTVAGAGARATTVDGAELDRVFDVLPDATAEISRLTITNGDAPLALRRGRFAREAGGGVRNFFGALDLRAVAVTHNTTSVASGLESDDGFGGGVGSYYGTTKVFDSVISGNRVPNTGNVATVGGGVGQVGGSAEIANTTVSRNAVVGNAGNGGGIAAHAQSGATSVKLTNATVTRNAATAPPWTTPSGEIRAGGNLATLSSVGIAMITTRNSIVANPGAGDNCSTVSLAFLPRPGGPITSSGGNLEFPGTSCGFTRPSDKQGQDPRLDPLADNGGPTNTHALSPGSPAIDAADNTACPATDQRGVQRPTDGDGNGSPVCDMGAFEREGRRPSPSTGPECTIRGTAGNDVIRGTPGRDVICAGAGNDIVYGLGGDDVIRGAQGNDILRGGDGDDHLSGGEGNDVLRGGEGEDRLTGGPGNDILYGNGGADALDTQDARRRNDVARGGAGDDSCATDARDFRSSC